MADNTRINMIVRGASVVTVPIDDTLAIAGQAADAKAVGDALEAKVDAESIMKSVRITWNGIESDNQGVILADADDLPVDGNDSVKDVLDAHGEAIDELGETVENAVLVTEQTLTAEQQAQVRENIGAAEAGGVVLVAEQTLTAEQQAQVRENIGAGDTVRITVVNISNLASLPQTITDARITADMVVVHSVLSNPVAQLCDWTVTAANGSLVIAKAGTGSGIGYGGTDLALYLEKTGSATAQTSTIKQEYATSVAGLYYARTFTESDEESVFTSVVRAGRIQIYKSGQNISVRLLSFTFDVALTAGITYTLATLPENCRIMLMQQSVFISHDGQYRGIINVSAGTGTIAIAPWGTNIPAGTSIDLAMPIFNVSRDHDDQDVTGFTLMTPTGS